MTARTSILHIQVDDETRERAAQALDAMGLSLSDGIGLFLRRVRDEQDLPFDLARPNAETRAAMQEANSIVAANTPRFENGPALIDALDSGGDR